MPERERMDTEEFAALVAAPLKAPVKLEAGFDARLMADIAVAARLPWWRRRSLAVSPIGVAALAAGFGAVMVLGGLRLGQQMATPVVVATAPDTVHVVRFVLAAPGARTVAIAGSFNGWSSEATPLTEVGAGQWTVSLTLPPGAHEYAFLVDGERWMADPLAPARRDEFGMESSILRVGGEPSRGT